MKLFSFMLFYVILISSMADYTARACVHVVKLFQISQLGSSLFNKFNFKPTLFVRRFFQNSCAEKCLSDGNPDT